MIIQHTYGEPLPLTREQYVYSKILLSYEGNGPDHRILLLMKGNGMGDDIHAMPVVWQKVQDGYDVAVVGREFTKECFTSIGAKFIPEKEAYIGWWREQLNDYGTIYSLNEWCISHDEDTGGFIEHDRFTQLARILDTTVPASFSWQDFLGATVEPTDYTVLALESSSQFRTYHRDREIKRGIHGKVVECKSGSHATFRDIIETVSKAKQVVAVDNGILNLALALGVPVVGVFGPTDERMIAQPFSRFHAIEFQAVRKFSMPYCQTPCSFQDARGYGEHCANYAECMRAVLPQDILRCTNAH